MTAFIALLCPFLVADWPSQSGFLSSEEKVFVKHRVETEHGGYPMDTLDKSAWKLILTDWKILLA